jgi:Effector Associated Constant Component 1
VPDRAARVKVDPLLGLAGDAVELDILDGVLLLSQAQALEVLPCQLRKQRGLRVGAHRRGDRATFGGHTRSAGLYRSGTAAAKTGRRRSLYGATPARYARSVEGPHAVIRVDVELPRYHRDSEAWEAQALDLWEGLRDIEGVQLERSAAPEAGTKGVLTEVMIYLGPTAVPAAVTALKAWLARDRDRAVVLTASDGSEERRVEVHADTISDATLREIVLAAQRD